MRTVFIALLATAVVAAPQIAPIATPESIAGPWELASGDGMFVVAFGSQANWLRNIQLRVYHRREGRWGWYIPRPDGGVEFDGQRLQIAAVGLDVTFQSAPARWTGSWRIDGENKQVILERPHPAAGAPVSPFCGQWEGVVEEPLRATGRLFVAQSLDGTLTVWMQRAIGGRDQRYGELLNLVSVVAPSIVLDGQNVTGPGYRYSGTLSEDGSALNGQWTTGLADASSMTLFAPRSFRRVQGCT